VLKMALRILKKAITLTLRSKKRFTVFTLMYTGLLFWSSFSLDITPVLGDVGITSFFIAMGISIFLSLLYAWIIVNYRRREIATLKCIGWTNKNCQSIIIGEILFTTLSGFIIVIEVLFHVVAVLGYFFSVFSPTYTASNLPLISLGAVFATFCIFVLVQLIGIFLGSRRVLKVRPIIALRKVGA
jgi:ABC-type lipoprotein release transport system permease subunit